jgi:hypothetical protein
LLESIIKFFQSNDKETIVAAFIIVVVIWIYKEVRNNYIESDRLTAERINKALEVYGELGVELSNLLHRKSNENLLDTKLSKSYPYLPKRLLEKFMEWKLDGEKEENIQNLLEKLNIEIIRLKRKQKDPVSYLMDNTAIGSIELFLHNTKVGTFIQPLKFLTGIVFIIIMGIIIGYSFILADTVKRVYILLATMNFIFYFMEFLLYVDIVVEKRFISSFKNWILIILFIIIPAILLFLGQWYLAILSTVLFWIHTIIFLPKNIRRTDE